MSTSSIRPTFSRAQWCGMAAIVISALMAVHTIGVTAMISGSVSGWFDSLSQWMWMIVGGLILLSLQSVKSPQISSIISQVQRFGSAERNATDELFPLTGYNGLEQGWNRLVETCLSITCLQKLDEAKLSPNDQNHSAAMDALLGAMNEGIVAVDQEGSIAIANGAAKALFGWMNELPEAPMTQFLLENCSLPTEIANSRFRSESWTHEAVVQGKQRVIACRRTLLDDQSPYQAVYQFKDITQRQMADVARQNFVATATHELRTPLANITAYAETLASTENLDSDDQKRFLNVIHGEADRLARFVDDLLTVDRMEAGAMEIDEIETNLERILDDIEDKLGSQVDYKKQELEILTPAKLPSLILDKEKVTGALINLLGNAIKYTPEGGRIQFAVNMTDSHISFSVKDSGIGIAPDEVDRIFDKFFRSDDPRVRDVTGTGLGLAFTQEVARLHGGKLTVESELNEGSTFTMTLPLVQGGQHV